MFISIHCVDYVSDQETVELCLFRGIRYDSRNDSAVLSTEHDNHDYVFPISVEQYDRLVGEIQMAIKSNAAMISLENGKVFRCKKGQLRRGSLQDRITATY